MAGAGKRRQLHAALAAVASQRGLPFSIQTKSLAADMAAGAAGAQEAGATEEGAGPDGGEAGQFNYEASLVHIGLDIARMSMQDKHILRPVLAGLGKGSQVLAGDQGRGARILVLYHAHLLSSESVLLLQACLEQNEGDLSVWLTSELPVPQRIRDWFVELAVGGSDHSFEAYQRVVSETAAADWPQVFRALLDKWRSQPPPRLRDVKEVKAVIYEMLMRNLRWVEATHFLLDVILEHEEITEEQRRRGIAALAACDATGGGYTIPSYRIPILWESLFLKLRTIFAQPSQQASLPSTDGSATSAPPATRAGRARKSGKKSVGGAGAAVAAV